LVVFPKGPEEHETSSPHRLKRHRHTKAHALPSIGMAQAQSFRVQHQARSPPRRARRIEGISQDRVPDFFHVYSELMAAPGLRHQAQTAVSALMAHQLPIGNCGLAALEIHMLLRPVRPIDDKRKVNGARLVGHLPPDHGHIAFLHLPFFELPAQMALGVGRQSENHHPRGIPIKPVHQKCLGESALHPRKQAVGKVRALARYAQQPAWLVDHENLVILMQDIKRLLRGIVCIALHTGLIARTPPRRNAAMPA